MPEQINDHEKVHDRFQSQFVQKVKNIILNSLSITERNNVLKKLAKDYNGIIDGNEEAIFREFIANVLSDMDYTYLGKFAELQKAYWKNNVDFIDNYKVSEYTTDTDAGGIIDNIGLGNDANLGSTNQLYISADEYAVVSQAIMSKNAGMLDKELKPYDFVYSANNLYVYENHSIGKFTIISKLDLVKNRDEIPFIKEAVNNGAYSNGQTFNNWIGGVRSERGRDNSYPEWIKNARTALYDGRLPNGTRRSNDVGYSPGDGKYSSENYVKYSFDSAETDTAELTPERQKEIFEQFEKDRAGVPKPSKISQWGERAAWVAHNMTRVFPNIPERGERGTFFAEFRKSMIQWKNLLATVLCCLMPV